MWHRHRRIDVEDYILWIKPLLWLMNYNYCRQLTFGWGIKTEMHQCTEYNVCSTLWVQYTRISYCKTLYSTCTNNVVIPLAVQTTRTYYTALHSALHTALLIIINTCTRSHTAVLQTDFLAAVLHTAHILFCAYSYAALCAAHVMNTIANCDFPYHTQLYTSLVN
jgi:hypothetical protein